jgi:spermidine/putrescine transport system substrate-binding protein
VPSNPGSLNILCWAGYEAPRFVKEFEERWNCRVHGETFDSDVVASERIASEPHWDLININNPYIRDNLYPAGAVSSLDDLGFKEQGERSLPCLDRFLHCTRSRDDSSLIGVAQRFGPFNLVIDSNQVSASTARDEGFAMADDPQNNQKFGILLYPEFNVMHAAIACGIDPFHEISSREETCVVERLHRWNASARLCTSNHHELNQALVDGHIRFYVSGGVYTAGVARKAGHLNIMSVTPDHGPIDGKGGIAFVEVTSICANSTNTDMSRHYLDYMLEPDQCHKIAFAEGVHNPVSQMRDPNVMAKFSVRDLDVLQFSTLDEDMSHCAPYATIPNFSRIESAVGFLE